MFLAVMFLAVLSFFLLIHQVVAVNDDVRNNVLVNGTKYKYQSFIEIGKGKYAPLFGLGLMILPQGEVPPGLIGSASAIFSSGYQSRAKIGQTGPQEVFIAKHVRKSIGHSGSGIASQVVDKSKLKAPLSEQ